MSDAVLTTPLDTAEPVVCFHCGEPVPTGSQWRVSFDGAEQPLCCGGCEAVANTILSSGLGDYYRVRTAPASLGGLPAELEQQLDALAVYDDAAVQDDYTVETGEHLRACHLAVDGMHCGACVWLLERSVRGLPGVVSASFNYSTSRAEVRFDPAAQSLAGVLRRVAEVGYRALPFDAQSREESLRRHSRSLVQRLFVAGIAMMQVMMYALPDYFSASGDVDYTSDKLFRWASLLLTTPVMLYSAQPFFAGAWRDLRERMPGMDVPVSIALASAFTISVWNTLTEQGTVYFDSIAMFAFLLLGVRYLEWRFRAHGLRTIDSLAAAAPDTAEQLDTLDSPQGEIVPARRLRAGDLIRVKAGARIPVDARVRRGDSAVDQALLTGESLPVAVGPGDEVPGGAMLSGAPLVLEVLRRQSESTLSMIDALIQRGAADKPPMIRLVDRIAAGFVTLVLLITALVFIAWLMVDSARAAAIAISVLVVSCPCALSLATPAALATATARLLRRQVLIARSHVLESLPQMDTVVFDKTGTLTLGMPELTAVTPLGNERAESVLRLAARLEAGSDHPFARSLRQAADALAADATSGDAWQGLELIDGVHEAGFGVEAQWHAGDGQGGRLRLGSAVWCGVSDDDDARVSRVYLVRYPHGQSRAEPLARFDFSDPLREDAAALIRELQARGLEVHLLSGDREAVVTGIAAELGIRHYLAGARPDDKQACVRSLQAAGRRVLMCGDGVNDAPVLRSADVSIAVGEAAALAQDAADAIVLGNRLVAIADLMDTAARTRQIIRQNITWAILYNLSAIPLAALGYVPPWLAAIGMAASSLLVSLNALRLWRGGAAPRERANRTVLD